MVAGPPRGGFDDEMFLEVHEPELALGDEILRGWMTWIRRRTSGVKKLLLDDTNVMYRGTNIRTYNHGKNYLLVITPALCKKGPCRRRRRFSSYPCVPKVEPDFMRFWAI